MTPEFVVLVFIIVLILCLFPLYLTYYDDEDIYEDIKSDYDEEIFKYKKEITTYYSRTKTKSKLDSYYMKTRGRL